MKTVAILGMGPSLSEYVNLAKHLGAGAKVADEIWTINALGDVVISDRIFHMDDLKIQEIRAKARPESNIAAMLEWLKQGRGVPVYTSRMRKGYPNLVEFPIEDVANDLGIVYFNSTAAYAVALAIHEKFERIILFGCDFTYPNAHHAEKGRACVEFLLGIAHGRGIELSVPRGTSLLDATESLDSRLYGMQGTHAIVDNAGHHKFKITLTDRAKFPTADEIEEQYDHSAHPNTLVDKG